MADYVENRNGRFYRNPLFIREVQDCEIEYMIQLLDDAYTTTLCHEEERQTRKLAWLPSKTEGFQVNSYYKQLRGSRNLFFF